MEKIESFEVDHTLLRPGVYLSRQDGDIYTYDMRIMPPTAVNTPDKILSNSQLHTYEHMFATVVRNLSGDTIYFGPMGCQTGFYLVSKTSPEKIMMLIHNCCDVISNMVDVPGNTYKECGNFSSLDLDAGLHVNKKLKEIIKNKDKLDEYDLPR
ncbi:S-ribosylhomocysteine lyase [Treponema sp. R6D11]